jgi:tetratricopeptide (TPR) repeat protein
VALDREDTLKKAEKLLRQGRLDNAIAEYLRVVEDQPRDWNTANTLGDLYARASQPAKAVAQYARIADHFLQDGFYPKAAALYKKILKLVPDEESAQLQLADVSSRLGLLKDAKTHYGAVAARRRARGDVRGAEEIVVLLGSIDPADFDARTAAARVLEGAGDEPGAAAAFRALHADLLEKGRDADALQALKEAVRLKPGDTEGRTLLARGALAVGDFESAREFLDADTVGQDPVLMMALADIELRAGQLAAARDLLVKMAGLDAARLEAIVALGWTLCGANSEAAFVCADVAIDHAIVASRFDEAAALLQGFIERVPGHIPALLKLVEVCVDGGLEEAMYQTQAQLADAYLAVSQASEARVIAEDLVAREPWESAHIERFRRALVMLRVPEPDAVIAERLSGQVPFLATDHFADPPAPHVLPVVAAAPAMAAATKQEPAPAPGAAPVPVAPRVPVAATAPVAGPAAPSAPAAASTSAPKSSAPLEIDLTGILSGLHDAAPPEPKKPAPSAPSAPAAPPAQASRDNLDDVFKDFRAEAARKGGPDQSAQHMKLARTYLEMEMLDEATAALKTAARSPQARFEAGLTLGRLYKEHGDLPHAIEWFERAAEVPAPGVEEARALMYDLAVVLEEAGETSRALAVLLELQAEAGDYRDAAERAGRLARVQTGG